MKRDMRKALIVRGMKLMNVAVSILLFADCWASFYAENGPWLSPANGGAVFCALYAMLVFTFRRTYRAFDLGISRISELVYSQSLADFVAGCIVYVVMSIATAQLANPLPLFGLFAAQVAWNAAWSLAANKLYFRIYMPRRAAVVYRQDRDLIQLEEIRYFSSKFEVQKYVKNPSGLDQMVKEVAGYPVVFVAGIDAAMRNGFAEYCIAHGVDGFVVPYVGDVIMAGAKHMQMFSVPIMRIRRAAPLPEYLMVKRAFDIVASLIAIAVASPFMLFIAAAIKTYDGGPILYRQVRLTRNGQRFNILKFRSMRPDAEKDGVACLASAHDQRITPVGKVIRAIRFDELPQLFNILKGEMTIVGPRPERPEIAAQYEREMPAFALRLQVKAGLTGYAQVHGRYNTLPHDKLQMDLMYINNMSAIEDLRLMFATVKTLFLKESTEGVAEGKTTAGGGVDEAVRVEKSA